MAGGVVAPINTDLIPNYANVFEGLKNKTHNSLDGVAVRRAARPRAQPAHVQHRRDHDRAHELGPGLGGRIGYAGKISVYDSSIYIADAALHLMQTQPDLGITNPYQLNDAQFDAAIALLEEQRDDGALYWGDLQRPGRRRTPPATSSSGRRGSSRST